MKLEISGDYQKALNEFSKELETQIVPYLARVGEEAVSYARLKGTYQDQTGNLRSSIGYAVFKDGTAVSVGGFQSYKDGAEGATRAEQVLLEKGATTRGYALVVVAGMDYASYVENIHGLDVLTGARNRAKEIANQLFAQ